MMRLEDRCRAARKEDARTAQKALRQARVDGLIEEARLALGDTFAALLQEYVIEPVLEGETTPVLRIARYMGDPYLTLLLYPGDTSTESWLVTLVGSTPQRTDSSSDGVAIHTGPIAASHNLARALRYLETKVKTLNKGNQDTA